MQGCGANAQGAEAWAQKKRERIKLSFKFIRIISYKIK